MKLWHHMMLTYGEDVHKIIGFDDPFIQNFEVGMTRIIQHPENLPEQWAGNPVVAFLSGKPEDKGGVILLAYKNKAGYRFLLVYEPDLPGFPKDLS